MQQVVPVENVPAGTASAAPPRSSGSPCHRLLQLALAASCLIVATAVLADDPLIRPDVKHVTVYHEAGRFAGWPANHGIWNWGEEIVAGFSRGYYRDLGPDRHAIDREKPEEHLLARSRDGGLTWQIEDPSAQGALIPQGKAMHGKPAAGRVPAVWTDCPGGINFQHPDFAMTLRMTDTNTGPSCFYFSYDRCRTWKGPYRFPDLGTRGIAARTDYLVEGPQSCLVFLTAGKSNGREGRPLCARTDDGGRTWQAVGWIAPEPEGYAIMPATVRLARGDLLTCIRCRDATGSWIDAYRSSDHGKHWQPAGRPVADTGEGNPACLLRLKDGRLCLIWGQRKMPFGIRARLSSDAGLTWGPEYVLRDDGTSRDIGYPRSIQRPDGTVVVVYYFCQDHAHERDLIATLWKPAE